MPLLVTGLGAEHGRKFLAARHIAEPAGVEWIGRVGSDGLKSDQPREVVRVGLEDEEYGLAQLEALADGALLVTTPSEGPYEAWPLAVTLGRGLATSDIRAGLRAAINLAKRTN